MFNKYVLNEQILYFELFSHLDFSQYNFWAKIERKHRLVENTQSWVSLILRS